MTIVIVIQLDTYKGNDLVGTTRISEMPEKVMSEYIGRRSDDKFWEEWDAEHI